MKRRAGFAIKRAEREVLPAWLRRAMRQARKAANGEQIPIVVVADDDDSAFIIMRVDDFDQLINDDSN